MSGSVGGGKVHAKNSKYGFVREEPNLLSISYFFEICFRQKVFAINFYRLLNIDVFPKFCCQYFVQSSKTRTIRWRKPLERFFRNKILDNRHMELHFLNLKFSKMKNGLLRKCTASRNFLMWVRMHRCAPTRLPLQHQNKDCHRQRFMTRHSLLYTWCLQLHRSTHIEKSPNRGILQEDSVAQ